MGEKCKTCRFWHEVDYYVGYEESWGECRRHAPTLNKHGGTVFPTITSGGWCGDYLWGREDEAGVDISKYFPAAEPPLS
jgi:hypothetical protein